MDPLWIVFITVITVIIIASVLEYFKYRRDKGNGLVNLDSNTTSSGTGVVYTIPTTHQLSSSYPTMNTQNNGGPVFIVQDTPPSYDQVVNMCPPPGPPGSTSATNTTLTTTTTIHER